MTPCFRFLTMLVLLFVQASCVFLPHHKAPAASDITAPPLQNAPKKPWHLLPRLPFGLPFFHHRQPPPKAEALQRIGVIKTLSSDKSFVIIELEPGVLIPPGRDLLITNGAGDPIRLRAAESQPPYFIADIKSGLPSPGQIVFQ